MIPQRERCLALHRLLVHLSHALNKHYIETTPVNNLNLRFLLSALERTFLGYLRTSLALSMVAVIIAQLFRLQHTTNPSKTLGFFILGIPLASICIVAAILVLVLGACRFWRQQNAILRGKVHAGGWELNTIGATVFLVGKALLSEELVAHLRNRSYSPFSCCL